MTLVKDKVNGEFVTQQRNKIVLNSIWLLVRWMESCSYANRSVDIERW